MSKTIEIPDDLYERLGMQAKPFEMPAQVIQRLLDLAEEGGERHPAEDDRAAQLEPSRSVVASPAPLYTGKLEVNFYPSDLAVFKAQLLERKEAWIVMSYQAGNRVLKHWIAENFKPTSDVMANLRSGYLRGWREKGLIRADVAINRSDLGIE